MRESVLHGPMNLGAILGIAAALYAGAAALMFLFQDRLLFLPDMPSRVVAQTPAAAQRADV